MALLDWKDDLSVKVAEIDGQHKTLVKHLNDLHDAMKNGKSKEASAGILKGLIDYTATHFKTEEKYMAAFAYPDAAAHKAEHDGFVKKVLDFQAQFNSGKVTLSIDIINFLKDWVTKHIMGTDKKYSAFFNSKGLK